MIPPSAGTQQPEPMYLISESIKKQMLRAVGKVQETLTWDCDEERALMADAQIQIFYRLWDSARGPVPAERPTMAPNRSDFPCREEYDNAMAEWNRDTTIAAQATAAENKRVLNEAIDRTIWLDGHGIDGEKSLVALIDVQKMLDSLRLAQPKEKILKTYTSLGNSRILIEDGFSTDWLFDIKKGETLQIVGKERDPE